jgi:L-ribulokinase
VSYALGLDFGTLSVRAIAVDTRTGESAAEATRPYAHGVIDRELGGRALPRDFALQSTEDYLDSALGAIREVLEKVDPRSIIGVGVDFTACTMLPVLKDGTPLHRLERFAENPHAWVKLWKHHAAQPEADAVNALARERGEAFLRYYSGIISSEWMLPKCWEIARRAPEVFEAADLLVDAGDWFVQQMTGAWTRNACAAGYKGLWNAELGFPSQEFLRALDPGLEKLRSKWLTEVVAPGSPAGVVSSSFSRQSGLVAGTPVSAATIDAHSGVAGMGVYREGSLSVIMGTSSCHMALSSELKFFDGFAGVVRDGILPGFYGYESGQPAVGDLFGWFARELGGDAGFDGLSADAAKLRPGESGLLALDWMNGNRSVLMDSDLSGVVLGLTLASKPAHVYRALIEATAFGTRQILDAHRSGGVEIRDLVVCGGLVKDPLILQIYADVTGVPVKVAHSNQAVALGAAIFGALAAGPSRGGFATLEDAIVRMTRPPERVYAPSAAAHSTYERLFALYKEAHDHFGRKTRLLKQLKEISTNG